MRFRIGFARSGKCAISQCLSCRRLLQHQFGWCMWVGGGGRGGFRSSKCCCCFLQLFSCLAGCASCAPMGSGTRTCTNELSIGCIVGGCSFQDLLWPLLFSPPHLAPRFRLQHLRKSMFSIPKVCGAEMFVCKCTISHDIEIGILAKMCFCIFFEKKRRECTKSPMYEKGLSVKRH